MREIKKIDVMSLAKVQAIIGGILGLILGIFTLIAPTIQGQEQLKELGPSVIIIAPILYAIVGFVSGLVIAFLYNLVRKWVGGIKIDIEDHKR